MTSENRPAPTLHDVAAHAGVSTATVSRALNFPDKVAPKTRELVESAISQLGYTPNFGARVMAARRTHTIGAIIPTMDNAIFARGLQAFQDELRAHGYTMLVATCGYMAGAEAEAIRTLIARGADALLLIGHARDAESLRFVAAQNVPALVTWAYDPDATLPSVGFDNVAAMRAMADAVLAEGHRQLGLITAPTAGNDRAAGRQQGIRDAMAAENLDPALLEVVEAPYGIENGANAFARLMRRAPQTTAVFCGNDVLAVGALRQARAMGLRVPEDISITGFDDIELAEIAEPPLTTVHVPHRDMGRMAAQMLVARLENGVIPKPTDLPTRVVRRGSLGPAPHA